MMIGRFNNKYWVVTILFVAVTQCFLENNIFDRIRYGRQVSVLEAEVELQRIEQRDKLEQLDEIGGTDEGLESFARERHRMIAPGEELFIIEK